MTDPRQSVAGVRFGSAGPIEYFHAAGMRLEVGESVIVETNRGPSLARVVIAPDQVVVNELGEDARRPILRLATDDDLRHASDLVDRARELLPEARALAAEVGLEGRIDRAEFTLDGERLTFLASGAGGAAEGREFARLAGERWGTRAAVRRLGERDRARLAGGYGVCGRELCCSNWLSTFPAVSMRLARDQELPLNPEKISGLCGRLLCCLSYEEEGYREMRRSLPRLGQRCSTPTGEGKVVARNVLLRRVTLNVGGQRVEVGERDFGLVVRWDPSARNAEPPPALSHADAVARGLIEPEAPAPSDPHPSAPMPEAAPIELGGARRGRPSRRRGRGRREGPAPTPPVPGSPKGRVFRRAAGDRPAGDRPAPPEGGKAGSRRRRRRRGGRSSGSPPQA